MKRETLIRGSLLLLVGLLLPAAWADERAEPRQDCYTIDRSRPEWGPGSSGIEDPPIDEPLPAAEWTGIAPNPFRIGTTIAFAVPPGIARARIGIYDPAGRLLRVLAPELAAPGVHHVHWDRRDAAGHRVPPGICFYRIELGEIRVQGRLVLVD